MERLRLRTAGRPLELLFAAGGGVMLIDLGLRERPRSLDMLLPLVLILAKLERKSVWLYGEELKVEGRNVESRHARDKVYAQAK